MSELGRGARAILALEQADLLRWEVTDLLVGPGCTGYYWAYRMVEWIEGQIRGGDRE